LKVIANEKISADNIDDGTEGITEAPIAIARDPQGHGGKPYNPSSGLCQAASGLGKCHFLRVVTRINGVFPCA